ATINSRIAALQKTMAKDRVQAWLILSADSHLSEYLPEYWKLREWFSGFTGSAGTLLVLKEKAYLWADSRYWVQAAAELKGSNIELMKMGDGETPSYAKFLQDNLPENSNVAVLGNTISIENFVELYENLDEHGITLTTECDPFDKIMKEARPELPLESLYLHDPQFVSESIGDKITKSRQAMTDAGADVHI